MQSERHVNGIILAAGMSSRMGEPKQLLPMGEGTLLEEVIEICKASVLRDTVVVLGHEASNIRTSIQNSGVAITVNHEYRRGISSSIRKGISVLKPSTDAAVFLLGDQPRLQAKTIDNLVAAYLENRPLIVYPAYKKKRGNPVLFDRSLFPRLEALAGDRGGSVLFEEFALRTVIVDVDDPGILMDIDTREDYDRLGNR